MFKVTMFAIFAVLTSVSAKAELMPLLKVNAQAYPGVDFTIGLDVGSHHEINGLYYYDPSIKEEKKRITPFSFETLKTGAVLVEKSGYKIVHLVVVDQSPNELLMKLTYLRWAIRDDAQEEFFRIRFNSVTDKFDVLYKDKRTGQERKVTSAYVKTHKVLVPVGIQYINFQ